MKKVTKYLIVVIITLFILYFGLGYLSSYIGWYGYKKWTYRTGSKNIVESKVRGVFVSDLKFQLDSVGDAIPNFRPFIEKGFKFGKNSLEETVLLKNSNYPFQLNFDSRPTNNITILIREDQLSKFDSSNASWGYLKSPQIKDTIILIVRSESTNSGIIKVWQ